MRDDVTRERLRALMRELAETAPRGGRYAVYLVGGGTAVLVGWRPTSVDAALYAPDDVVFRDIQGIKERLGTGIYTPVVEEKVRAVSAYAESIVERAIMYDVKMAFGTDAGVFPHGQNAREFGLMRKGGMSDKEAFASATTVAAEVLGLENEIGRIAPGFSADIIAVKGNPLDDVTVLEDVDWVMVRGRVIE